MGVDMLPDVMNVTAGSTDFVTYFYLFDVTVLISMPFIYLFVPGRPINMCDSNSVMPEYYYFIFFFFFFFFILLY